MSQEVGADPDFGSAAAWFGRSADVMALVAGGFSPEDLLDPEQKQRRDRLQREQDRIDFVAARVLAALVVAARRGIPRDGLEATTVRWRQRCDRCGGPHGAPRLVDDEVTSLSWAHSAGFVAAAAGPGALGIDVQLVGGWHSAQGLAPPPALVAGSGSGSGNADARHRWHAFVRAEACVKAGLGDLDQTLAWPLAWTPGADPQLAAHGIDVSPALRAFDWVIETAPEPLTTTSLLLGCVVTDAPHLDLRHLGDVREHPLA